MSKDQIERRTLLHANLERVWAAIRDSREFGTWFGVEFNAPFAVGQEAVGTLQPTKVDAEVAKLQEAHRGTPFRILVEQIQPMHHLSFRWNPYAVDPATDYAEEPMTLVAFELERADDGVVLTVTETGFEQLPEGRRDPAFAANSGGWDHQLRLIAHYLALDASGWNP